MTIRTTSNLIIAFLATAFVYLINLYVWPADRGLMMSDLLVEPIIMASVFFFLQSIDREWPWRRVENVENDDR